MSPNTMLLTSRPSKTRGSLYGSQHTHNNISQLSRHPERGLPRGLDKFLGQIMSPPHTPFTLFEFPQLPTFTLAHHPSQATCIDHFLIYDSRHVAPQSKDIHTIPHAFLDHIGVKATINIPLLHPPTHSKINTTCEPDQPRSIRFHFPSPQPVLAQWSEEMREATEQPTFEL